MADDGLIAAYLRELAYSVRDLPDAEDIVAEAADHLYSATEVLTLGTASQGAQAEAVARFGSAALIARVCTSESRRGAAVPTTRTRQAGFAALLAPLLVISGQMLNVLVPSERGPVHGIGIALLVVSLPLLLFGLWGLVRRHGGLGWLGRAGFVLAVLAAPLSLLAGWAAVLLLTFLLAVAMAAVSVQTLRAGVLPVVPVVMVGGGTVIVMVGLLGAAAAEAVMAVAAAGAVVVVVGFMMLGWYLWHESAVDGRPLGPLAA